MNSNNVFLIEWQDQKTKTALVVKYINPWQWSDIIDALKQADGYFKSIDHKAVIIHDQSDFPVEQSTMDAIKDIWGRIPLPPANLQACFIVNPKKSYALEFVFEIVEKAFFRRIVTRFVGSLEEVSTHLRLLQK